ncbi:hypothetical protein Riv7116_2534 [Rivularia sp. PCC 7116]|uniref:hypothetical protein n=1 Tax=Rivularia sp. PCC 7116 TaxID=373994 RepID=UPI00029ED37F|nr:hypothetical protein [Rivularia sp. PCC 7116]AFY55042.1 hypothetical protein Riv7116_2534 [Rivularia sp. PCC 7116]
MNLKLARIVNLLAKSANTIVNNQLSWFGVSEVGEAKIELEDLQQAVIHLKDAVDVMKPLENSARGVEVHDLTTAFLFLESARDALFRASIPNAAKAMNKVIRNIKLACKTKSRMYQKILIARVLDGLNQVLYSVEKSINNVVTPIVTHMTYEELLSKLAAYSSGTVY